jgi:hypothetical protein
MLPKARVSAMPLARKLSLKHGLRVWWDEMPASVRAEIDRSGYRLQHLIWPEPPVDAAHVFVTSRAELAAEIRRLRPVLAPTGFIWVSWPKAGDELDADTIRDAARAAGLADVKTCAVGDDWSGLKLVIRKESPES